MSGNAENTFLEVLLPEGKKALQAKLDGKSVQLKEKQVESSNYVLIDVNGVGVHTLEIII